MRTTKAHVRYTKVKHIQQCTHVRYLLTTEKNGFLKNGNQENVVDCDI